MSSTLISDLTYWTLIGLPWKVIHQAKLKTTHTHTHTHTHTETHVVDVEIHVKEFLLLGNMEQTSLWHVVSGSRKDVKRVWGFILYHPSVFVFAGVVVVVMQQMGCAFISLLTLL